MLLSYDEMVRVLDNHQIWVGGRVSIDVVSLRKDLEYSWAFDELQVRRVLMDMEDKGLL